MSQGKDAMGPTEVRNLSVEVYKQRLVDENGAGAVERVLAKDDDEGQRMRERASSYDALTRAYVKVFERLGMLR